MINVFGSDVGDAELALVKECFDAQWLGLGPKVAAFEKEFAEARHLPFFLMTDNASNSFLMAWKLLDLPPGSEVIIPTFTFPSCANSALVAGLVPVFADVAPESGNVTADSIERADPNHKAKAIMVVHYAGLPVDVPSIRARFPGIPIVEDAAHAAFSDLNGVSCGMLGDIGVFSFDGMKNIAAGEAGGICVQTPAMYERAKVLRNCGIAKTGLEALKDTTRNHWWEQPITEFFIKMKPSDVTAAIALGQLRRSARLQSKRARLFQRYYSELSVVEDQISLPPFNGEGEHSYFTFLIRCAPAVRDALAKYLLDHQVYTTLRFQPLHTVPFYEGISRCRAAMPSSEYLADCGLCLPLHPRLTEADVSLICNLIRAFLENTNAQR